MVLKHVRFCSSFCLFHSDVFTAVNQVNSVPVFWCCAMLILLVVSIPRWLAIWSNVRPSVRASSTFSKSLGSETAGPTSMKLGTYNIFYGSGDTTYRMREAEFWIFASAPRGASPNLAVAVKDDPPPSRVLIILYTHYDCTLQTLLEACNIKTCCCCFSIKLTELCVVLLNNFDEDTEMLRKQYFSCNCKLLFGFKLAYLSIRNSQFATEKMKNMAVTYLVQRVRAWEGCGPAQSPPRCTKCNSPPINGQCTNFILFDVAL